MILPLRCCGVLLSCYFFVVQQFNIVWHHRGGRVGCGMGMMGGGRLIRV